MSDSPISLRDETGIERFRGTQSPAGGGGSQPLTDPTTIPGCALWLDASQIVGLSDGDPVATWADESGNGYDAAQGTSLEQPVYKAAAQNGLPVVRFDGSVPSSLAFSGAALSMLADKPGVTLFAAVKHHAQANDFTAFFTSINGDPAVGRARLGLGGAGVVGEFNNTDLDAGSTFNSYNYTPDPTPVVILGVYDADGIAAGIEGSVPFSGNNESAGDTSATAFANTASDAAVVGVDGAGDAIGVNDLAELLVYDRFLNAMERRQVMEYLSAKWATF